MFAVEDLGAEFLLTDVERIAQQPVDGHAIRFVHIDLSRTRDSCGIAVVKQTGQVEITAADTPNTTLVKPIFAVEAAISIKPNPNTELIFSDLRGWLLEIIDQHGIDIYSITMDGYQSADTMQIFRRRGIKTWEVSVDRTPEPYEYFRECLYEGRVAMVDSATLVRELIELERNMETGSIDHPPRGSKDVADAVCGAIYAASRSRQIRNQAGYYDDDGNRKKSRRPKKRPAGRRRQS